jgi:predicted nucleic acid-binding protein
VAFLDFVQGNRIYLDTNVWIYAIEDFPEFSGVIRKLFQAIDQGRLTAFTSELSLAEALVKPIQSNSVRYQEIYKAAIAPTNQLSVIPVDRNILIRAAQVRANTGLKLPDSIHVATAISTNCTTLVTNDRRMRTAERISVIVLSQLNQL